MTLRLMHCAVMMLPLLVYAGDDIEGIGGTGQQQPIPQDSDMLETPDIPELPEIPEAIDALDVPEVDAGITDGDMTEAPDEVEPPDEPRD